MLGLLAMWAVMQSSCNVDQSNVTYNYPTLPAYFDTLIVPKNNPTTELSVRLGKILFEDKRLSLDSTLSCVSCHKEQFAMADNLDISPGVKGRKAFRNAPSLLNVGFLKLINKDGGIRSLDLQALTPIEDHDEMGISILEVVERLKYDKEINRLAKATYNRSPDAFVITRALASFVRTQLSFNSGYDRYLAGDTTAMAPAALRGLDLFNGRANCSSCHSGFLLTNQKFENNGTKQTYSDIGLSRISLKVEDKGKFRVQSLRNVAVTAPYMHDGSFPTLESVLEHYNRGGNNPSYQSKEVFPLDLSADEMKDIIAFLNSLTDDKFAK